MNTFQATDFQPDPSKGDVAAFVPAPRFARLVSGWIREAAEKSGTVFEVKVCAHLPESMIALPIAPVDEAPSEVVKGWIDAEIESRLSSDALLDAGQRRRRSLEEAVWSDGLLEGRSKALSALDPTLADADKVVERRKGASADSSPGWTERAVAGTWTERGHDFAVAAVAQCLLAAGIGYARFHNERLERRITVREYEDLDEARLPDRRFSLELRHRSAGLLEREAAERRTRLLSVRDSLRELDRVSRVALEDRRLFRATRDWSALKQEAGVLDEDSGPRTEDEGVPQADLWEREAHHRLDRIAGRLATGRGKPKEREAVRGRLAEVKRDLDALSTSPMPAEAPGLTLVLRIEAARRDSDYLGRLARAFGNLLLALAPLPDPAAIPAARPSPSAPSALKEKSAPKPLENVDDLDDL